MRESDSNNNTPPRIVHCATAFTNCKTYGRNYHVSPLLIKSFPQSCSKCDTYPWDLCLIYVLSVCHRRYGMTVLTVFVKLFPLLTPFQSSCQSKSGCSYYLIMFISWPIGHHSWASWDGMMIITTEDCHNHYLRAGSGWKSPHLA